MKHFLLYTLFSISPFTGEETIIHENLTEKECNIKMFEYVIEADVGFGFGCRPVPLDGGIKYANV